VFCIIQGKTKKSYIHFSIFGIGAKGKVRIHINLEKMTYGVYKGGNVKS
jgi:hypothetical protein